MKLIVTDHADPSVGLFAASFVVESPFETHEIGDDCIDYFKQDIIHVFMEYATGRVTAMYDFEMEANELEHLNNANEQEPEYQP